MKKFKNLDIFLISTLCLFTTACNVSDNSTPNDSSNITNQSNLTDVNYSQEQNFTEPIISENTESLDNLETNQQTVSYYEEPIMPEPFDLSNPSGGDQFRNYTEEYELRFENLTFDILNLVPKDDFSAWINKYTEKERASEERIPPLTILDFVMEFDISKDQLLSVIVEDSDPSWTITREDVDVIFSGDMELINKTFINEYSVLHNNKIYTPEWLYNHTTAEYMEAGLSNEEVLYVMEKMKDLPFTPEAKKAIENKYRKFRSLINEAVQENNADDYTSTTTTSPEISDDTPQTTTES